MKTKNVSLLLGILLVFTACVDVDHTLGVSFIPSDEMMTVQVYKDSTIAVYTAAPDSMITSSSSYGLFGSMCYDPFGTVEVGTVFRMYPAMLEKNFGTNPSFVSARLRFTGSGNQAAADQVGIAQNVRVYSITKTMSDTLPYYNNSLKPAEVAELISQSGIIYNGGDTLSIALTPSFGNFLLTASAENLLTADNFYNFFKGFYIKTDPLPSNIKGGRINSFDYAAVYLELKYRHDGQDSTVYFLADQAGAHFNTFEHESLSRLQNLPPNAPKDTVYFEGLAGVKPSIDFAEIKTKLENLAASQGKDLQKLVIANAQIIIGVGTEQPDELNYFPSLLSFCYKYVSDDNYITYSPLKDVQLGTSGAMNRSTLEYSIEVTDYLINFLQGKRAYSNLLMMPIQKVPDAYGTNYYYYLDNVTYSRGMLRGTPNRAYNKPSVMFKMTYTFLQ